MHAYITIPEPCHEDWQEMTPVDKGRHCAQCCKTVIDFSNWEPQEILFYLKAHQQEQVCGRFRNEQLNVPIPTPETFVWHISQAPLSEVKKIAAIFLFVFGLMNASCNTAQTPQKTFPPEQQAIPADSADHKVVGGLAFNEPPRPDDSSKPVCIFVPPVVVKEPEYIKGDIDIVAEPYYPEHTGGAPVVSEMPDIAPADTASAVAIPAPLDATERLGKIKISK